MSESRKNLANFNDIQMVKINKIYTGQNATKIPLLKNDANTT